MIVILNPMVTDDLGDWQHYRIVKSLLYQGESKLALRYISSKQPHLSSPKEVKIKLTVLLANGQVSFLLCIFMRQYYFSWLRQHKINEMFLIFLISRIAWTCVLFVFPSSQNMNCNNSLYCLDSIHTILSQESLILCYTAGIDLMTNYCHFEREKMFHGSLCPKV